MNIKTLSPSKLKSARLCDARLLSKMDDEEYTEAQHELARAGTVAHEAAMHWYRPNDLWVSGVAEIQAAAGAQVQSMPPDQQWQAYNDIVAREVVAMEAKGIVKHPRPKRNEGESDEDYLARCMDETFKKGMNTVNPSDLPLDAGLIDEAKSLFGVIVAQYDINKINVVFAERRYKGTLANGVPVHLIIDLAIAHPDGSLEIIDYKTGYVTMSLEDMYSEDQVLMNLLAVTRDQSLAGYPVKKFTYFWVRTAHETGPVEIDAMRLGDYEHYLSIQYQRLLDLTPETVTETPNAYCGSCGRRFQCKAFRELVSDAMTRDKEITPEELAGMSIDDVMGQYSRVSGQMKILDNAKSTLSAMLLDKLDAAGARVIEGESYKVTKVQGRRSSYRTPEVMEMCKTHDIDPCKVMSPTKKDVESAFAGMPAVLEHLVKTSHVAMNKASPRVSEITAKKAASKMKKTKSKEGSNDTQS